MGASPGCPVSGSPALVALPPRRSPPARVPSSPDCLGCSCISDDHDGNCNAIGVPACKLRLAYSVFYIDCPNLTDAEMFPCAFAKTKAKCPSGVSKKVPNKSDSLLNALRNAKELASEFGFSTPFGWPLWWRENVVLEYCARPDGLSICECLKDPLVPAFRHVQHTRHSCIELLSSSFDLYSHFGTHLPTDIECFALQLPQVFEFEWPSAKSCIIKHLGHVVAVCSDGILWIADTGCGYHLVPECDVSRGKSAVVPNPGATRLHTANGEVNADECVKFSLREIKIRERLATILPETPRVLSVGVLCMDERATFHWPAGGTPFFTLFDGTIVECEVHGRVPYLRSGAFLSAFPGSSSSAKALPSVALSAKVSPLELEAPPLVDLAVCMLRSDPSSGPVAPPACVGEDEEDLPPLLDYVPPPAVDEGGVVEEVEPPPLEYVVDVPANEHLERARKAEATSLRHLMTHHPKNSYCTTCCCAKSQRAPHRRKHHKYWKGKPRPDKFGDQITADHIIAYSERSKGVTGHQAAVVFGDRATGWFDGFPIVGKSIHDTTFALLRFQGSDKIKRAWSDNSPELIATFHDAKVVHDTSTQGQPQSNGRAERLVRRTMDGTKTLTMQAGLPGAFWPYAMRAYCHAQNIDVIKRDSAWNKRHDQGQWDGPLIPFGCLVDFKPQKDVAQKMSKGVPDTVPGVFLGYKLQPGGLWQGEYRVSALTEFVGLDLTSWGNHEDIKHQVVKEIVFSPKSITFPLRAKYDYVNRTLEGLEGTPFEAEPDEPFSELQEGPLAPPVSGEIVVDPAAPPPVPIIDSTDHGRPVRGTEIIEGGKRYRVDASGRRYLLDESGSIIKKNSSRPPYIPDIEWRVYDKKLQNKLTAEWKLSIALAVDAEIKRASGSASASASTTSASSSISQEAIKAATACSPDCKNKGLMKDLSAAVSVVRRSCGGRFPGHTP